MDQIGRVLTGLVCATLLLGCAGRSMLDAGRIRTLGAGEGWVWTDGPVLLDTAEALYDRIDGEGEGILALGWKASAFGVMKLGNVQVFLAIHEMRGRAGAEGLLAAGDYADAKSVEVGDKAIYWRSGLLSEGIIFLRDNVYCEITIEKKDALDELGRLAAQFDILLDN